LHFFGQVLVNTKQTALSKENRIKKNCKLTSTSSILTSLELVASLPAVEAVVAILLDQTIK